MTTTELIIALNAMATIGKAHEARVVLWHEGTELEVVGVAQDPERGLLILHAVTR